MDLRSRQAPRAATVGTDIANLPPYGNGTLPPGIRSRPIANVNGLTVHILEAGYEVPGRPAVLLLHGFPELAYSWRKVMLPLAAAEYHVIAPDQRGYGRTIGWDDSYDADPDPFRILNMVRDAMGLAHCSNFLFDHLVGEREELGRKRRHGTGQARAGYLVRSIKVSTACITEVCGLRKQ